MKKHLKKSMSAFLALLMVFSMFVFTPEMFTKASAADDDVYGTHKVRMYVQLSKGWTPSIGSKLYLLYKESKNGEVKRAQIGTVLEKCFHDKSKTWNLGAASQGPGFDDWGNRPGIDINGFPVGWDFSEMATSGVLTGNIGFTGYIEVYNAITGSFSNLVGQYTQSVSHGNSFPAVTNAVDLNGSTAPKYSKVAWDNDPTTLTCKVNPNNDVTVTSTEAPTVYDQYGSTLTTSDTSYKLYTDEAMTRELSADIATASSNEGKLSVTVHPAAANWILQGEDKLQRTLYAKACYISGGTVVTGASTPVPVTVSNYDVTVKYDLGGGEFWDEEGDAETKTETVTYGGHPANIPTSAYRKGYTFNGIFTTSIPQLSTQVTADTVVCPQSGNTVTYYAQWNAIDNFAEFYNSDGQFIAKRTGKYDGMISAAGTPDANPEYPGKTTSVEGTYTFDKWVVWSAPGHPEWEGATYDDVKENNFDLASAEESIKFIATYTLGQGSTVKNYTAEFKLHNGSTTIKEETGAYWTPIFPNASNDARLNPELFGSLFTEANGFDRDNFDYSFLGWTTVTPENGKWGTEDDLEYKVRKVGDSYIFTDLNDAEYTYRIKNDVVFYPCYSATAKKCSITRKAYEIDPVWKLPSQIEYPTVKSEKTTIGSTYDLGAPDTLSFNYNGYTYTFIGWSNTDHTFGEGTDDVTVEYIGGKAEYKITGNATFFAVYEKAPIQYNAYFYNGTEVIKTYNNLPRYNGSTLITYTIQDQIESEDLEKLTRERSGNLGYTFVGWVEDPTNTINPASGDLVETYTFGEQSKSFYAAYRTFNYYTVSFYDDRLLQISSDYVAGDVISYTDNAPENADMSLIPVVTDKLDGVKYQYTFMGWKSAKESDNTKTFTDDIQGEVKYAIGVGENITVNADKTYTAVFKKELRKYNISLYNFGTDLSSAKVNADGYACYTDGEGNSYFIRENKIYTNTSGEYVLYEGELKAKDLTAVKPDAMVVISLEYGKKILDAVREYYKKADGTKATEEADVSKIADTELKVIPSGEEEEKLLPYETDQYKYFFNGWAPAIDAGDTVNGDKDFVAKHTTGNVIYKVHWFTPETFASGAPYAPTAYSEETHTLRYKRIISMPAKTPTSTAPVTKANYTWTFLGWYECDENKVIKTDKDGNEIKFAKGSVTDPGDSHNRNFYYVAKFGYVANNYTVNVYNEDGTKLLGTYKGEYNQTINLYNFAKAADENYHYTLTAFAKKETGETVYDADLATDTTAYPVTGNINLKTVYTQEAHDWANATVIHTTPATYKDNGVDTLICSCGYKKTVNNVPALVDTNGPVGKVAIRTYNWDKDSGESKAFIRKDSLVAIMASDRGQSADIIGEGSGIKSISYTWSNGENGVAEYEKFAKPTVNLDIQVPQNFTDGMTLTVVITDWIGEKYTITTGALYVDAVKPVIEAEVTCEGFTIAVAESNLASVEATLDGEEFDLTAYKTTLEGYSDAYIAEKTDNVLVPSGKYVITAKDKAGNTASVTFTLTNAHSWNAGKVTKEVTCAENGEKTFSCTVCGETKTEVIVSAGHKWNTEYTVDKAATCEIAGEKSIHCSVCGEVREGSKISIDALGHDKVTTEKKATCEEDGYLVVTCKRCDLYEYTGADDNETYKALGHKVKPDAEGADEYGFVVGTAATCTTKGTKYQLCSVCEEHINVTSIPLAAHSFEDTTPDGDYCEIAPVEGATKDTYHVYTCSECGYSYEFNAKAKEHDYEKTLKTEASCTDDAVYTYTCTACSKSYDKVERLTSLGGHKWNTEYTVDTPETCTTEGAKSIYCSVCGELKEGSTVTIPASHKFVATDVPATCHSEAKTVYTCSVCTYSYEVITGPADPSQHTWDEGTVTKPATCTEEGEMTYTCKDEGCNEKDVVAIAKKAHEKSETVIEHTDATCKALEKTVYKCKNCTDGTVTVYGEEYAEHTEGTLVKTLTRATCTEEGEGIYNCSVCGQTFKAAISATAEHNYVGKVTMNPTCTANGVKTFTCTVCKDSYTEDIEKLGHDYKEYTIEATCTANGSTFNKCTRCGEIEEGSGSDIEALEHDIITVPAVSATCTKTGLTEGEACSRCGHVETAQVVTEKLAHTKGTLLTVNRVSTCASEGEGVYICTVCTGTFTDKIPVDANAHNWDSWNDWSEDTPATCTVKGSEKRTRSCLNTGCAVIDEETRETDALGHDFVVDHVGEPVTVSGVTTVTTYYKCSRCVETKTEDEITTLFTATVDGEKVNLFNGEKLTEAKIAEVLGTLPSKEAQPNEDGVYEIVWKLNGVETKLPAEVSKNVTVTYTFKFVPNTYTVTFFNANGKIISQADYVKNATVTVPDDQYVSGHKFLGWTDGLNDYPSNEIPNVTKAVSYTPWLESNESFTTLYVTFRNDTGTKTLYTASVDCRKGEEVSFELPADLETPTKERNSVYHYVFSGWVDTNNNPVSFPMNITKSTTLKATFSYEKHTADKKTVKVVAASCTSPEVTTYQCNKCAYKWDEYTADAKGHSYREVGKTVDGNTTTISYYCDGCGDTYTRTVTSGGQKEVIVVKVSDGSNPVAGAKVVIYQGKVSYTATTDDSGCAYFDKATVGDGIYQVNISKDGYKAGSGKLNIKNGTGLLKLSITKEQCHCGCHRSGFFGDIKRFFNKIFRLFNKNYKCCSCGECEKIY